MIKDMGINDMGVLTFMTFTSDTQFQWISGGLALPSSARPMDCGNIPTDR
jgi:hypothetical protein